MGAATEALIAAARSGVAATANPCPQFEQNAAPSAITPPHLEQYTESPLAVHGLCQELIRMAAKSYLQAPTWSILDWTTDRRQEFHRTSTRCFFLTKCDYGPHLIDLTWLIQACEFLHC